MFRLRAGDMYDTPLIFQDGGLCKLCYQPTSIEIQANEPKEENEERNMTAGIRVENTNEIAYDTDDVFETDITQVNGADLRIRKIVRKCTGLIYCS